MVEDDIFEQFKKSDQYDSLLKIFNQVTYGQKIVTARPNTAYIYCNVTIPEYEISTTKKLFDYDTTFRVNNPNIFQGTIMFYSKNQYLGCYNDINNILYLIDVITPFSKNGANDDMNNDLNINIILKEIIHIIDDAKEENIRSIKHDIMEGSKSKIMLGSNVYDLTISDARLSFFDRLLYRLLHKIPAGCLHLKRDIDSDGNNNDNIYSNIHRIYISHGQDTFLDSFKREISEKAQKIIAGYRQKYYDDTANFKHMHQKIIESNVPMPQFPPDEVVKSGLMMAVQNGMILHMFKVDIKVHSVVDEKYQKYAKLRVPINFDNGLLIIRTSPIGDIIGVKFKHSRKHFHVHDSDVCLGSAAAQIAKVRIKTFQDILKLKSSIINIMSVCNVSNMYDGAYMAEEVKSLMYNAKPGSLKNMVIRS